MSDRPVGLPAAMEVSTRAGRLSCDELGSGPPVLLLASGGHDHGDWDLVRPALADHFRTIAPDWPGHGRNGSPSAGWTPSTAGFADAVEDVIDAVASEPVALIGNSVGGFAAARLAIRRPERVRALVLVAGGGFRPVGPPERLFNWAMSHRRFMRVCYPWFARWYVRPDSDFSTGVVAAAVANARRPGTTEVLNGLWRSFSTPQADLSATAGAISVPTLLVWGRRDPVLPPAVGRRAARLMTGARLVVLDTGHVPFATKPDAFLAEVLPFLLHHHAR
jgi:pimeloyl-ACP methyl ester carboxylesterase